MIELEVTNLETFIKNAPTSVTQIIDDALAIEIPGAFFARNKISYFWDGKKHLFSIKRKAFPTGCIRRVIDLLNKMGYEFRINDLREKPKLDNRPLYLRAHLRDYQEKAIEILIQKQRGIIQIATGGGKSLILVGLCSRLNIPTLVLVHRQELMYQLEEIFRTNLRGKGSRKPLIGLVGDGNVKWGHITIGMMQALDVKKYEKELNRIEMVLVDECHHLPCNTMVEIMKHLKNAYFRFGVSATSFREDGMDLLLEAYLAPIYYNLSNDELTKMGYLVPVKVFFIPFYDNKIYKDDLTYSQLYEEAIEKNEKRNNLIAEVVKRVLATGKSCLVAVSRIDHGKILTQKIKSFYPEVEFVEGSDKSERRKKIIKKLNLKEIKCVVCTTVFGEGIDIPTLDVLVSAKAQDSGIDALQLAGRVTRKVEGKNEGWVIDIFDHHHKYFKRHAMKRKKIFEEVKFDVREVKWNLQ
jgi:superfamily II DNA or RNA helicase